MASSRRRWKQRPFRSRTIGAFSAWTHRCRRSAQHEDSHEDCSPGGFSGQAAGTGRVGGPLLSGFGCSAAGRPRHCRRAGSLNRRLSNVVVPSGRRGYRLFFITLQAIESRFRNAVEAMGRSPAWPIATASSQCLCLRQYCGWCQPPMAPVRGLHRPNQST